MSARTPTPEAGPEMKAATARRGRGLPISRTAASLLRLPALAYAFSRSSAFAEDTPTSAVGSLPHDLSPWSMFMSADVVVKAVMVGLALASVTTWTVWLAKGVELLLALRRAKLAMLLLVRAESLAEAERTMREHEAPRGAVADLVAAATHETTRSDGLSAEGVKERLAIALSRIEARAGRGMTRGTGLLATIGATAPFVGLFGTVWGIMNSFIGISRSHTTNLAVVAPGIAEALLATAIGLVAAIPAVVFYNVFARSISGYRALLADASGEVMQHVSRDLERAVRPPAPASRPAIAPAEDRLAHGDRATPRATPLRPVD